MHSTGKWVGRMIDELEALVGHVFVVGGRAVSTQPPGALVQLPPKKPQRGREQDTFFTLVTPAGMNQGQASLYEQLARLAADWYFRSSGGVTSGLREAVAAVNSHLIEHNQAAGQRYEANMICLVFRGREAYVARAGSCLCLFRQGEGFLTFPDDLRDEYALNSLPLGYSPVPDIKLAHYDVAPGHVMVLSDAGLAKADRGQLRAALGASGVQAVMEPLKTLGGSKLQAMVIEFVSIDTPDPAVVKPEPGAKITRSSRAPAVPSASPLMQADKAPPERARVVGNVANVAPAIAGSSTAGMATAEPLPPVSEIVAETGRTANRAGRRAAGGLFSFLSVIAGGLSAVLDRLLPEPEENTPRIPAMMAAALAILVPVVVVFIVVALRLSQVDVTQFEQTVHEVEIAADQAATIPLTDVDRAKTAWLGVLQRVDTVETNSGRTGDPTLARIRARAQFVLDTYARVTRRTVTPLRSFNEGTKLMGPIIRGGVDMYTMDVNNSAIYRDTLNQNSNSIATRATQPVVQQGQAVGTRSVRKLLAMTWMAEGGVQRANVLAALDSQGLLVTYSPTFAPATSQPLPGADRWGRPNAMTTWNRRLYVLDPDANQIWRYIPEGDAYPTPPEEYFDTEYRPDLKTAVDLAIDSNGNVFVLFSNGTLKKFNAGTEQRFEYSGMPDGGPKSANAMFLDNNASLPAIYISDPVDMSIFEITLGGTFQHRYRAADDSAFRGLSGLYVERERVYVASGAMLYTFSISDLTATPTPKP